MRYVCQTGPVDSKTNGAASFLKRIVGVDYGIGEDKMENRLLLGHVHFL